MDSYADDDSHTVDFDHNTNSESVLDIIEEEDITDKFARAEVLLPHGGESKEAVVVERSRDINGKPIRTANGTPLLDSLRYIVRFQGSGEEDQL